MKYKRAMLTEPYKFGIFEEEVSLGKADLLIKVASCGLCNWELNFWKGHLNYFGYPHRLGHEWAGVVVDSGPEVKKFQVDDKVSCFIHDLGGFSEYMVVPEINCEKLADHIDPKYAMGEPQKAVMTVLHAAAPAAGDNGVIVGCGPMGLWCTQILSGGLLNSLIAVDVDDGKLALAKKYGASHTINSKNENTLEKINEYTNGLLADFIIEGTGIPAVLNEAQNYVKEKRGRLILMSSHEEEAKNFDFRVAIKKSLELLVAHGGFSASEADDFRRAVSLINKGKFSNKEIVTHEFLLEDIETAFKTLEHKPINYLKGIVVPN